MILREHLSVAQRGTQACRGVCARSHTCEAAIAVNPIHVVLWLQAAPSTGHTVVASAGAKDTGTSALRHALTDVMLYAAHLHLLLDGFAADEVHLLAPPLANRPLERRLQRRGVLVQVVACTSCLRHPSVMTAVVCRLHGMHLKLRSMHTHTFTRTQYALSTRVRLECTLNTHSRIQGLGISGAEAASCHRTRCASSRQKY
jgi:hypothetical protein